MIKSVAMMLANSFDRQDLSDTIMTAVDQAIDDQIVTPDLGGTATTDEVTDTIIKTIKKVGQHNYEPNHV